MKVFGRKKQPAEPKAATPTKRGAGGAVASVISNYAVKLTSTVEQDIQAAWTTADSRKKLLKSSQIDIPRLASRTTVVVDTRKVFKSDLSSSGGGLRLKRELSIRVTDIATLRLLRDATGGGGAAAAEDEAQLDFAAEVEADEESTTFDVWFVEQLKANVTLERMASLGWEPWSGQAVLTVSRKCDKATISLTVRASGKSYVTSATKLFTMWDSTRYFVLEVPLSDGSHQCVGVGFNEREAAAAFRGCVEAYLMRGNEALKRKLTEIGGAEVNAAQRSALDSSAEDAADTDAGEPTGGGGGGAPASAEPDQYLTKLRAVRKLFVDLLRGLEPANTIKLQTLESVFARAEKPGNMVGEWPLLIEELFQRVVGEDSPVARVLALVNQSIVIEAATHLRLSRPDVHWRDVKEAEGWQVRILICPDVITVQHVRREQSLATQPPEEYFKFEWQLWMVLSGPQADRIESAQVKINDLTFSDRTSAATKSRLNAVFSKGVVNI